MSFDFKIDMHRNSDNLHLRLSGDFDSSSAEEVIHTLKRHCHRVSKIFIHTSCLRRVLAPETRSFFEHVVFLKKRKIDTVLTGDHVKQIDPTRIMKTSHPPL